MKEEDYTRLLHGLEMGDIYCYPEDKRRIDYEISMGASYESLIENGIIKTTRTRLSER